MLNHLLQNWYLQWICDDEFDGLLNLSFLQLRAWFLSGFLRNTLKIGFTLICFDQFLLFFLLLSVPLNRVYARKCQLRFFESWLESTAEVCMGIIMIKTAEKPVVCQCIRVILYDNFCVIKLNFSFQQEKSF